MDKNWKTIDGARAPLEMHGTGYFCGPGDLWQGEDGCCTRLGCGKLRARTGVLGPEGELRLGITRVRDPVEGKMSRDGQRATFYQV